MAIFLKCYLHDWITLMVFFKPQRKTISCDVSCARYQARKKLTNSQKPFDLNSVLPKGRGGFRKAKVVASTLSAFMASTDQDITIAHVPSFQVSRNGDRDMIDEQEKLVLAHYCAFETLCAPTWCMSFYLCILLLNPSFLCKTQR